MRLYLGDTTGAQSTSTAFGITPPYTHSTPPAPLDTAALVALGRDGYHTTMIDAADFNDATLDGYLDALKTYLTGLGTDLSTTASPHPSRRSGAYSTRIARCAGFTAVSAA